MAHWVRLTLPAAAVAVAPSAYAVQYLSIEAAQKLAFPSASRFVQSGGAAWKAQAGDKVIGLFVVDHVIGKHLYIDYAVALDTSGRVMRVDILQYRESYGARCASPAGSRSSSARRAAVPSRSAATSAIFPVPLCRRSTSPRA